MSMMKTLAKLAVGVALAKGASSMMKKRAGGGTTAPTPQREAGQGGLFGGLHSPRGAAQANSGGLDDLLGSVLGGQQTHAGHSGQGGGLGGLLETLSGGKHTAGGSAAGMNDLLRGTTPAKDMGGFGEDETSTAGFGDMLNQAIARQGEPDQAPTQDQEAVAALMLRAMIQAMKSDGEIDAEEEQRLLGRLGDVSAEEMAFVKAEMGKPVDAAALAAEVPRGLEAQLYTMSVMGIDLDTNEEAKYLHTLAQALGLEPATANDIHAQLGVPQLYR